MVLFHASIALKTVPSGCSDTLIGRTVLGVGTTIHRAFLPRTVLKVDIKT